VFACLDEVIRQVTLNCTERGYMLIKIRDEINLTIYCYQELFESIIAHGIRKALLASAFTVFVQTPPRYRRKHAAGPRRFSMTVFAYGATRVPIYVRLVQFLLNPCTTRLPPLVF